MSTKKVAVVLCCAALMNIFHLWRCSFALARITFVTQLTNVRCRHRPIRSHLAILPWQVIVSHRSAEPRAILHAEREGGRGIFIYMHVYIHTSYKKNSFHGHGEATGEKLLLAQVLKIQGARGVFNGVVFLSPSCFGRPTHSPE